MNVIEWYTIELFALIIIGFIERAEVAFVGFSFYSNVARIFSTRAVKDEYAVIHGVRVLSFAWLTYGQSWVICITMAGRYSIYSSQRGNSFV